MTTTYTLTVNSQDGSTTSSSNISTDDPAMLQRLLALAGVEKPVGYVSAPDSQPVDTQMPHDHQEVCDVCGHQDCQCDGPTGEAAGVEMREGIDTDYPDTAEGAIQALGDMSTHNVQGATAIPDPHVDRVWLVKHSGGQSIVYLKKPDDIYSHRQPMNDFEDIEGMQVAETADYDHSHEEVDDQGEPLDVDTYTWNGPKEPQRIAHVGNNPLAEQLHGKLQESWQKFLAEEFNNEDGQASPLTDPTKPKFDKDPFAGDKPQDDGSMSPMSKIRRQKVTKG